MAKVSIVVGSVYGAAKFVGDELKAKLAELGHEVSLSDSAGLEAVNAEVDYLIVCTSSTGSGDLPGNIAPFYATLVNDWPRITHLKFAVIGLGDSSYANSFNGAARLVDHQLEDMGAQRLAEPLLLDACETVTPEDQAVPWALALIAA